MTITLTFPTAIDKILNTDDHLRYFLVHGNGNPTVYTDAGKALDAVDAAGGQVSAGRDPLSFRPVTITRAA